MKTKIEIKGIRLDLLINGKSATYILTEEGREMAAGKTKHTMRAMKRLGSAIKELIMSATEIKS